jgi:cysteine-rich repeat protein
MYGHDQEDVMQGDVFGEGVVIRARSARWVMVCVVVIAATAAGCTESSSDEQDLAQDTGSADTGAEDSDVQPLDADAQTRPDAPDSDVCEGAACGCAKTLESGEVAYEVCGADALCCEQAVEGIFLGCIDPASDQRCGACGRSRCVGSELCCWSAAEGALSCIDPTTDINNCGGCSQRGGSDAVDPMFSCGPGQLCERNFNYSLTRPPEEQNASGVFIGQCVIECAAASHVICPGGINPETSLPYALDAQACVDPLSSVEFCGAVTVGVGATETTGQCSERDPQTFGELKNFAGVRCAPSEVCRLKLRCDHPEPLPGTDAAGQPCSPQTHYYYDVAADSAGFPDAQALPDDSVFIPDDTTRGAYIENPYLRAVCDTTCRADQVRCVDASGAPFCVDPNTDPSYCGASLAGSCEDNTATGGADDDGEDCNSELPNTVSAQCVGGACANPVCALGFADCDGDASNGCEVDLSSPSNLHCGGCSTDATGAAISGSPRDGAYDGAGANEACDDGNTVSGDGCSATCQAEAGFNCINLLNMMTICTSSDCGNGVVNTGDMCDPAPAGSLPTATCNIDCTFSACGDGRRNPHAGANEACDDGNTQNGDGCSATCQVETGWVCADLSSNLSYCTGFECGNGVIGAGEQCDPAPPGSLPTTTCNADCTFSACGDGRRNPNAGANEACDDGNTTLGDGCSATCQVETGFVCAGPANGLSICTSP